MTGLIWNHHIQPHLRGTVSIAAYPYNSPDPELTHGARAAAEPLCGACALFCSFICCSSLSTSMFGIGYNGYFLAGIQNKEALL